jgi:hypothetical protein
MVMGWCVGLGGGGGVMQAGDGVVLWINKSTRSGHIDFALVGVFSGEDTTGFSAN